MTPSIMPADRPRGDDPNSKGRIALIVVFSGIAATLLLMAPAVAGQLFTQMGLTPTQTGDLFAVELGAMSLASLPALLWIKRANLRVSATLCGAVFVAGNLLSGFLDSYGILVTVRGITSFAGGSLMVLAMALAAQTRNRDRVYGLWSVGQLTFGAIGLAVLPRFFETVGIGVVYWTLATAMLLALPLVRFLPAGRNVPPSLAEGSPEKANVGKSILGLIACSIFYIGLSGIWTFTGGIAAASAIDPATSGLILSAATLVGILGSAVATLVGGRASRRFLLIGGYLGMIVAVGLFFGTPDALRFAGAALLFKFAWPWTLPFLMSTLADLDRAGRATNLANLFIGGGFAVGPFIAGRLIESEGGYSALVITSSIALVVSLILVQLAQPKRVQEPESAPRATSPVDA
ncbi:MFS transporter [Paenarthrobacter nitroguajacolicus]|uniref:MFS transporter n=1 Tax=Paenarthrobacter nitroguajacolicus TaxID=211146 RepID=UPI00341514A4